jgi:2-succinyl-5-enolpyruvyl-6-hydroxy-3-cyclohexene-1-carboxylate synthase
MPQPAPHRNTFYAQTFVDALVRSGLDAVCIAPGSRSTPLTLAFAEREREVGDVTVYSHLDERSAGFFALGMSIASGKPTALVCTSGTAAANFFPAIIEANMSCVPLIVLTADRPPELRHSGANQTIDQVKLYGDHVLGFVDMALPEANPPAVAVRNVRTTAARAVATAMGHMEWRRKGVVHLNFPFRKPLEPVVIDDGIIPVDVDLLPTFEYIGETETAGEHQNWIERFQQHERGVVIFGADRADQDFLEAVSQFATIYGYPVLAEPLSGMRFRYLDNGHSTIISGYDSFMGALPPDLQQPDVIVRFGAVPTSKAINQFVVNAESQYIVTITRDGVWQDDGHLTTQRLHLRDLRQLLPLPDSENRISVRQSNWLDCWTDAENAASKHIDALSAGPFFDGAVVAAVVDRVKATFQVDSYEPHLFVGNSSPIRHIEQFRLRDMSTIHVHASRGASGIDGQVSTALGIGAATGEHIYAILGDITFYHDMNGLLAVRRNGVSATFIVVNNNGGGIFERLPIRDFEPYYTEQFLTPHGLTFEHSAAMYGLEYALADDFASLDAALDQYMKPGISAIIEAKTDIKRDEARRKEVVKAVQDELRRRFGSDD